MALRVGKKAVTRRARLNRGATVQSVNRKTGSIRLRPSVDLENPKAIVILKRPKIIEQAPFHLLTECYIDSSSARQAELIKCLRANLACGSICSVHVFGHPDAIDALPIDIVERSNLIVIERETRLTFKEAFEYASSNLADQIVIVTNSDIYMDATIEHARYFDLSKNALSLTRWDIKPGNKAKHYGDAGSFDTWIFRAPFLMNNADFYFGIPGCDNRIAYEMQKAGRAVLNPSLSIRTYHVHGTNKRNYVTGRDKVQGPYLIVGPTTIDKVATRQVHVIR